MKLTIIYDNEAADQRLQADWGFSCLVQNEGEVLLFDTGAQGKLLISNMIKLGLDPGAIPSVFISHSHWDHIGGLKEVLQWNPGATVYLPPSCPVLPECKKAIIVKKSGLLWDGFYSTGELQGIEQSLIINTSRGLVVVSGCAHPGVETILKAAGQFGKVIALVGGLHGFSHYELLKNLELICPCHCTQHQKEIMARFPAKTIKGGAGKILEFQ